MYSRTEPSYESDSFDIFRGPSTENSLWVDTVIGFASARRRMEQLAAQQPGDYFIFCAGAILAKISSGSIVIMDVSRKGAA